MYENYLQQEDVDLVKDGVSYTVANLYLSDTEFMEFMQGFAALIQKAMENKPLTRKKSKKLSDHCHSRINKEIGLRMRSK